MITGTVPNFVPGVYDGALGLCVGVVQIKKQPMSLKTQAHDHFSNKLYIEMLGYDDSFTKQVPTTKDSTDDSDV